MVSCVLVHSLSDTKEKDRNIIEGQNEGSERIWSDEKTPRFTLVLLRSTIDRTMAGDDEAEAAPELVSLTRAHVQPRLSVLGRNPFTQAHVYTTATLTKLRLVDLDALGDFPHIQVGAVKQHP